MIQWKCIYVLWLRELKKFSRSKSRIIGMITMPLFILLFFGMGFRRMAVPGLPADINYVKFLVPGMIGMNMLFTSIIGGISVLWDREFGFLKEIMVAPVSRISIVLGRIAGGMSTAMINGILLLLISLVTGLKITGAVQVLFALLIMLLISASFISVGLIFASRMKDMQGFSIIMNFVTFPLLFLSGAMYPIANLPAPVRVLSYLDPLTYGVDALRYALLGSSALPVMADMAALSVSAAVLIGLGAYFFETSETL